MRLIIEQETAQAIVDYLVQKPFAEVAGLIDKLSRLQPLPEDNGKVEDMGLKMKQESK